MPEPRIQRRHWTCPSCSKSHNKAHWPDHHQEEPNWEDKLGEGHWDDKGSNPDYQYVCEVCGTPLTATIENKHHDIATPSFCRTCQEPRQGVHAPSFCPHCGWTQERIVLVQV